jgi:hypothetical protein
LYQRYADAVVKFNASTIKRYCRMVIAQQSHHLLSFHSLEGCFLSVLPEWSHNPAGHAQETTKIPLVCTDLQDRSVPNSATNCNGDKLLRESGILS